MVVVSSSATFIKRGVAFQRRLQSVLGAHHCSTTRSGTCTTSPQWSTKSTTGSSTSTGTSLSYRWFSAVELSDAEVDAAGNRSTETLISKEDLHTEEKQRTRISDVRRRKLGLEVRWVLSTHQTHLHIMKTWKFTHLA